MRGGALDAEDERVGDHGEREGDGEDAARHVDVHGAVGAGAVGRKDDAVVEGGTSSEPALPFSDAPPASRLIEAETPGSAWVVVADLRRSNETARAMAQVVGEARGVLAVSQVTKRGDAAKSMAASSEFISVWTEEMAPPAPGYSQ